MKIAHGTTYRPVVLDYVLAGASAGLTIFTAGLGISAPLIGQIFLVAVVLGTLLSWLVQSRLSSKFLDKFGAIPYTIVVIAAVFLSRDFSSILPDNPFEPRELLVSGILFWMIVLGSFFAWTEGTMLFQAVPCIALFGLIGVYDTYRNAVYAFFGFMMCFAMQFSRSHARSMLRQASSAGYGPRSIEHGARTAPTFEEMLAGPWRWAAGPGWALASAGVVIIISWIGAPVLQQSMKGVAGVVRVPVPQSIRRSLPRAFEATADQTRIGAGPLELTDEPVVRISMDRPRYLRSQIFQTYTGRGWRSFSSDIVRSAKEGIRGSRIALNAITDRDEISFGVEVLDNSIGSIPFPGELASVDPPEAVSIRTDGTITYTNREVRPVVTGRAIVPKPGEARDSVRDLPPGSEALVTPTNVSPEIQEFARQAILGANTDYEQAMAIKRAIEKKCRYNLRAEAAPGDVDPVSYFLFQSREGYCDLFASSMVLMARSVGLPARYVTGYFPIRGERDSAGRFVISESEGHAWAELFFEGKGWIPFDATEGAQEVPGGERGASTQNHSVFATIGERALDVVIVVLVGSVALLLIRTVMRRLPAEEARRSELDREYVRFARSLAAFSGQRRHLNQTPREYLEGMRDKLGDAFEQASELTERFERAFYSPIAPQDTDLATIRGESSEIRSALKKLRKAPVARA